MTQKPFLLAIFFCNCIPCSYSQTSKIDADFTAADSVAATVKYHNDIFRLTKELVSPFSNDLQKTRAIFKWITNNIRYDIRQYNKYLNKERAPGTFRCRDDNDCEAKRIIREIRFLNRILRKKKAICGGYAKLFQKMCSIAGIHAEVVKGYVRTESYQVGTAGTLDHAWNMVRIDSVYYTLDATWAAGGCSEDEDGKLLEFTKQFKPYYWLTPAADFARNHFPEDGKRGLPLSYTKEKFSLNPYYAGYVLPKLQLISPATGIIEAKQGDTIHFKFDYDGDIDKLQINSNIFRNPDIWMEEKVRRKIRRTLDTLALKKQRYVAYKNEGSIYEFDFVVPDNSLYYLAILFDREKVMRFKVNTPK